jgi:hypothetical protein
MWKVAFGLPVGIGMSALGQAEPVRQTFPYADLVLNGGALAVLAWAVWNAYRNVIPNQQKEFSRTLDAMADRYDQWERQRHEDSGKLTRALHELSLTCAKIQAERRRASGQNGKEK